MEFYGHTYCEELFPIFSKCIYEDERHDVKTIVHVINNLFGEIQKRDEIIKKLKQTQVYKCTSVTQIYYSAKQIP